MYSPPSWRGFLIIGLATLFTTLLWAQFELDPIRDIPLKAEVGSVPYQGGGWLRITISMPEHTHITSRDYGFFFVEPDTVKGIVWGITSFPPSRKWEGEDVYQGDVGLAVPFTIAGVEVGSTITVEGTVGYQVCTEQAPIYCTAPVQRRFKAALTVVAETQAGAEGSAGTVSSGDGGLTVEQRALKALESGSLMALLWIFIGGVLLSFTPCVYPIIPITIAYIGARSGGNRLKGLSLSLVFVLGLGIVYSLLGVVAAATGGVFGLSTQNRWVIGFVTMLFLVMGIGMLGAFDINLPASLQTKLTGQKRKGYVGALLVGGTTGLVAAPCVGPVLVALLGWVSATGNLFLGFLYLFVFAMGLGVLFVVIGTFAGVVSALPQAGGWMETIKKGFGIVLVAMALYFGRPLVHPDGFILLIGLALVILSVLLGGFTKLEPGASIALKALKGLAVFVLIAGLFYTLLGFIRLEGISLSSTPAAPLAASPAAVEHKSGVQWIYDNETAALAQARQSDKPLLVDFWAEWCAACKELDHKTFSDPVVYDLINSDFVPLKIDGTKVTEEVKAIWERYTVRGLPTVLILTPEGEELTRFEAFRTVDEVLPLLNQMH